MGPQGVLTNLHAFLREVKDRPFQWGAWDCLLFTNEAWRRMHGVGWADDWAGRYLVKKRPVTRSQLRREYGYQTIEDALSARLKRSCNVPPRGALVLGGKAILEKSYLGIGFGICVGSSAAFLSASGVTYHPVEYIESAWMRNDAA